MRFLLFLSILVLLSGPFDRAAAQCNGCPGDLDGNGQVSVDEIITVVNAALSPCDPSLLFNEDFLGSQLDHRRWAASLNGNPADAIAVANGVLDVGVPGGEALDFPYLASAPLPVPADGRVTIEVVMRFTGTGANASVVSVLGANGRSLIRIANDDALGLTVTVPGARGMLTADPKVMHTYSITFRGDHLDIYVDGVLDTGNFPYDSPPQRIWIGYPTIGQTFGIDQTDARPSGVDDAGVVTARSWQQAEWSSLEIDAIRLRRSAE